MSLGTPENSAIQKLFITIIIMFQCIVFIVLLCFVWNISLSLSFIFFIFSCCWYFILSWLTGGLKTHFLPSLFFCCNPRQLLTRKDSFGSEVNTQFPFKMAAGGLFSRFMGPRYYELARNWWVKCMYTC